MKLLILGDLLGRTGREAAIRAIPELRARLKLDFVAVNAENASHGFGLAPDMAQALFAAGADAITLGNHAWDRREIIAYIAQEKRLIRPLNYPLRHARRRLRAHHPARWPPRAHRAGHGQAVHGPAGLPLPGRR
jgi:calcineurin-like phosphoesterase